MFGGVLFGSGDQVLSSRTADLFHYFVHWRQFGFSELRHGNLALWNPHYLSGTPFFGGFQSALLYPPNLLFLVLPLGPAINWSIALHVFLAGAFTYAWTAQRRLHPLACFGAGVIFMFCGAHFLHIYAGHLPNLCTLVWAPLLFLAIDLAHQAPANPTTSTRRGAVLLGALAVAMQIYAGHPQYLFYTGIAAGIYTALHLIDRGARLRLILALASMYAGGVALGAVQLFTSMAESRETMRNAPLPFDYATMFSFPPENLMTLVAPWFFGDLNAYPYWGRCYLWEMSVYLSIAGLVLAVVGAIWGRRPSRGFAVIMVAALLLLALGQHTPLFKLLYHWAPGFDKFRGVSKFMFLAAMFLALLAAAGLDRLLNGWRAPKEFIAAVGAAAILLGATGLGLRQADPMDSGQPGAWHKVMLALSGTGESYLPRTAYEDSTFARQAGLRASHSLLLGAALLGVVAGLLCVARRAAVWLLVLLVVGDLFWFGRRSLDTFPLAQTEQPAIKAHLQDHPGDYRILNLLNPNAAMTLPADDIGGDDPGFLRRYGELLAFTQGQDPDQVTQYLEFTRDHSLYDMLRRRYSYVPQEGRLAIYESTNFIPRLLLVSSSRVLWQRSEIFAALTNAAFDPRREVILESAPQPQPQPSADPGTVRLVDFSTDRLRLEADVKSPAILLVADAYAKGWRATPEGPGPQPAYQVLPANYCLRAVPLAAGHHRLRLEYSPWGFRVGKWISLAAVLLLAAGLVRVLLQNQARRRRAS